LSGASQALITKEQIGSSMIPRWTHCAAILAIRSCRMLQMRTVERFSAGHPDRNSAHLDYPDFASDRLIAIDCALMLADVYLQAVNSERVQRESAVWIIV
jgi:hypothetical protein